jgi:hypothetical protein
MQANIKKKLLAINKGPQKMGNKAQGIFSKSTQIGERWESSSGERSNDLVECGEEGEGHSGERGGERAEGGT